MHLVATLSRLHLVDTRSRLHLVVVLLLLLLPLSTSAVITESALSRLRDDLAALAEIDSTMEKRVACKRVIRRAESMIESNADSSERFSVLGVVFEVQKIMFTMRQSQETHDALIETAKVLLEAPDEYAEVRVEPDMMLVQMKLAEKEDSPNEGALEIARFADRYRATSAEAQSLMMAATIAFDLGHVDLLKAFRNALSQRFTDDPEVAIFMRERFATGRQVHLSGQFKRADGKLISLPMGQTYVVCFWSMDAPLLNDKIGEIKGLQERYKDQFKVFSFNLDELPDAGRGALKRMELDWIPMLLPGGVENPTWRAVGGVNLFSSHVVGPYGLMSMNSTRHRIALHQQYEATRETPRRLALLRSILTGEFLVLGPRIPGGAKPPYDALHEVRACFPLPPVRYRLTPDQELANYIKAERLCGEVVAKNPGSPDLWLFHNHRAIALLGMWRLTGALDYLDRAVASAKATLAMKPPPVALVVPQFCLATRELMKEDADVEQILATLVEKSGDKSGPAHAAAFLLALEAHSRDLYEKYRDIILSGYVEDLSAWPVTAFLLDGASESRVFEKALPGGRGVSGARLGPDRSFRDGWTAIDGTAVDYLSGTDPVVKAVVFVEPGGDAGAEANKKNVIDHLVRLAAARPRRDMTVTGVFCCDDTNKVAAIMKQNKWSFRTACLSIEQWQRPARELGVFSADLRANVFIVRPDGTIMLALSGVSSDSERWDTTTRRVDSSLRGYGLELADKAFAANNYGEAAAYLETSFPLKHISRPRHEPLSLVTSIHGRKLTWAYMKAGDWKRALDAVNRNIALQMPAPNPRDQAKWCRICYGHLYDACRRVVLLRKTGDSKKANEVLESFDRPKCPHGKAFDPIWNDIEAAIEGLKGNRNWAWAASNPKQYLDHCEQAMREWRQNLYGYGIDTDLAMRARIHEELGNHAASKADRRDADVRAWPFKVREYDPEHLREACIRRRKQARAHLWAKEWKQALELANLNIEIHESEGIRCNSMCKICWAQVQSFSFRVGTLQGLGRNEEAAASREMAELCKCPPGKNLESYKCFPINRMYGAGSGINRLNYIESVMRGENPYCNHQHAVYRLEFAADLSMRADALEALGDAETAALVRKRSEALAFPKGRTFVMAGSDGLPDRYEDLVR